MSIEIGTSNGNVRYNHRALAPRRQRDDALGFETPTRTQLDTLDRFIHDDRIPAPVAYGIKMYMDRNQMTFQMASDSIGMLIEYVSKPQVKPVTEPGIYVDPKTGEFHLVRKSQIGRLYALNLVINDAGKRADDGSWERKPSFDWIYQNGHGVIRKLAAEWKATSEQVKQWGDLFGHCIKCHAELTRQDSIERGMGPTCWRKQFS